MRSFNRSTGKPKNSRRGFTLVELLVVVGMIALITGAVSTSMSSAMQRARIQKATAEVAAIAQAILAYENNNDLPTKASWVQADKGNIGFLLGKAGNSKSNTEVPVLIQAALSKTGVMRDPWGMPYYVMIIQGSAISIGADSYKTGYYLPNFYRLTEEERK